MDWHKIEEQTAVMKTILKKSISKTDGGTNIVKRKPKPFILLLEFWCHCNVVKFSILFPFIYFRPLKNIFIMELRKCAEHFAVLITKLSPVF